MSEFRPRQLWKERDRVPVRTIRLLTQTIHWGEPAWTALLITRHTGDLLKHKGQVTCILRESTLRLKWDVVRKTP